MELTFFTSFDFAMHDDQVMIFILFIFYDSPVHMEDGNYVCFKLISVTITKRVMELIFIGNTL